MRRSIVGCLLLLAAGCGQQAPESSATDRMTVDGNAVAGVAFEYSYAFRMPASLVGALQDGHADACERLGPARCTITGLNLTVDESGDVDASLSLLLERSLARRFGREAVVAVESAGGALTGSRITGTDAASAVAAQSSEADYAAGERARIDAELARTDLGAAERAELRRQRAQVGEQTRTAAGTANAERARLAATPITISYESGRGVGAAARLKDTLDLAGDSAASTVVVLLQVLAVLGPPVLLIALLWWLALRFVVPAFRRLARRPAEGAPPADPA